MGAETFSRRRVQGPAQMTSSCNSYVYTTSFVHIAMVYLVDPEERAPSPEPPVSNGDPVMQLLVTAVMAFHTGRQLPPGPGRQDGVTGSRPPGFANITCGVSTPMPSIPHSGSPGPLCYLAENVASGFILGQQPVAFKASHSFLFSLTLRASSS